MAAIAVEGHPVAVAVMAAAVAVTAAAVARGPLVGDFLKPVAAVPIVEERPRPRAAAASICHSSTPTR